MATDFNKILRRWTSENGLTIIKGMRRNGSTIRDVATRMGISVTLLSKWRKEYPELDDALAEGKEILDYRVEDALVKAALGYRTKEVTSTVIMRYGKVVEKQTMSVDKEMAPNVYAIQTYLFNRLPEKWKRNRDQLLEVEDEDSKIQITVTRAGSAGDEREQANILPEPDENEQQERDDRLNDEVTVEVGPGAPPDEFNEQQVYGDGDEFDEWDEDED